LDLGNGVTLVLVRIPAGTFQMGSAANDPDADDGEKPRHRVTISKPIYLGQTEVTVGQFKRFVADTNHRTEAEAAGDKKTWKDPSFTQTDLRPVVYVSWNDAQEFCTWLGKKTNEQVNLPTEAEWECSCRAGSPKSTKYHFGDDDSKLGEYAWYAENTSKSGPRPCGQKLPNAFELYDMHGNVWEWCRDGKREYTQLAETNPLGPLSAGSSRVYRGGAFLDVPRYCRVASRFDAEPSRRYDYLGFRVSVSR
jgi:formylglycine-generating enzyme required for sulfatase activity